MTFASSGENGHTQLQLLESNRPLHALHSGCTISTHASGGGLGGLGGGCGLGGRGLGGGWFGDGVLGGGFAGGGLKSGCGGGFNISGGCGGDATRGGGLGAGGGGLGLGGLGGGGSGGGLGEGGGGGDGQAPPTAVLTYATCSAPLHAVPLPFTTHDAYTCTYASSLFFKWFASSVTLTPNALQLGSASRCVSKSACTADSVPSCEVVGVIAK